MWLQAIYRNNKPNIQTADKNEISNVLLNAHILVLMQLYIFIVLIIHAKPTFLFITIVNHHMCLHVKGDTMCVQYIYPEIILFSYFLKHSELDKLGCFKEKIDRQWKEMQDSSKRTKIYSAGKKTKPIWVIP